MSQATPADWQFEFERWPVSRGPLWSLIGGEIHYVEDAHGAAELSGLAVDPWATRNLIDFARRTRER